MEYSWSYLLFITFAVCCLQNTLVSFPICLALLRFLPEDRAQFLAFPAGQDKLERGKMFRGWSAWLERRPVALALLSLEQGRLRRQLSGVLSHLKVKGQGGRVAIRETSAEYKEKKFSLRVVKHWNGLWEVQEPCSSETSRTLLGKDINSLFISSLQWQRLDLCGVLSLNNLLFYYIVKTLLAYAF